MSQLLRAWSQRGNGTEGAARRQTTTIPPAMLASDKVVLRMLLCAETRGANLPQGTAVIWSLLASVQGARHCSCDVPDPRYLHPDTARRFAARFDEVPCFASREFSQRVMESCGLPDPSTNPHCAEIENFPVNSRRAGKTRRDRWSQHCRCLQPYSSNRTIDGFVSETAQLCASAVGFSSLKAELWCANGLKIGQSLWAGICSYGIEKWGDPWPVDVRLLSDCKASKRTFRSIRHHRSNSNEKIGNHLSGAMPHWSRSPLRLTPCPSHLRYQIVSENNLVSR